MVTVIVTKFGDSQNPSPNLVKKIALFKSQYTLVVLPRVRLMERSGKQEAKTPRPPKHLSKKDRKGV